MQDIYTDIDIDKYTDMIIKKSIKQFIEEMEKQRSERARQKTEYILKNYDLLKAHAYSSVASLKDIENNNELRERYSFAEIIFADLDEDLYIESIRRSRQITLMLVMDIDSQLIALKNMCIKNGSVHKYDCFIENCINGLTLETIAKIKNLHPTQVKRWKDEMINNLSDLIFGINIYSIV